MNPYSVVKDFEKAVAEYTGAPYCVSVSSCTMALLLAVKWYLRGGTNAIELQPETLTPKLRRPFIEIPKRTYCSVPMSIIHAGGRPVFRDESWIGAYQLKPLPVWDCARWFSSGMFNHMTASEILMRSHKFMCTSFHWTKTLSIGQGGAILHDNPEADAWFRRMRFDGRTEGVAPKDDDFHEIGYHCYMSPRDAAEGLSRLAVLPKHNDPLPNDDYPDLSKLEIFK